MFTFPCTGGSNGSEANSGCILNSSVNSFVHDGTQRRSARERSRRLLNDISYYQQKSSSTLQRTNLHVHSIYHHVTSSLATTLEKSQECKQHPRTVQVRVKCG
jgi:hypothetical protein